MQARRVSLPPDTYSASRAWLSLLITVVVCLPPLLVNLGQSDIVFDREGRELLTSRETWQHTRMPDAGPSAWLIPTANGMPQLHDPPLNTLLHTLAWIDLDPATVDDHTLIWRARMVSVLMSLVALMATYWAGVSVGGIRVARLAAMALGTTLLFIFYARWAMSDATLLGFSTLAVAAGLWALRPLKPLNPVGRRVVGWFIAGVALGAAVLTKGLDAPLFVLPPLVAAIILTPQRRIGNTMGLIFAVVLGLIIAAPWYMYVLDAVPGSTHELFGRYGVPQELFVVSSSHLRLVMMLSPWIVWIVGGLCQPFMRADHERRRQLLIAWFWFVLVAIAFSIPAAKDPRYLLPVVPAIGLMVGSLWGFHAQLATERLEDPGVNLLRVPHWVGIGLFSIGGPLYVAMQDHMIRRGMLEQTELPGLGWIGGSVLGVVLVLMAIIGTRWHFKWRPRLAAYATVAWMVIASTVGLYSYSRSYHSRNESVRQVPQVRELTRGYELTYLDQAPSAHPDATFLFHLNRVVSPIKLDALPEVIRNKKMVCVLVRADVSDRGQLDGLGFELIYEFDDGAGLRLLYRPPLAPAEES